MELANRKNILDDYYTVRETVIDHQHEISRRAAKLRQRGISGWTPDDYKFMFAFASGKLDVDIDAPKGLMTPEGYMGTRQKKSDEDRAKRGLFNPKLLFANIYNTSNANRTTEDPAWMLQPVAVPAGSNFDPPRFNILNPLNLPGKLNIPAS